MTAATTTARSPPGATRTWLTILRGLVDRMIDQALIVIAMMIILLA